MKKFRFRLQKVLDYRDGIAEERKREYMEAVHKLERAEHTLQTLRSAYESNLPGETEMSESHLDLYRQYAFRLSHAIARQEGHIEECKVESEHRRELYIEADREAEVLKTFKGRKKAEYESMILKEDEKAIDETATQRYAYNKED